MIRPRRRLSQTGGMKAEGKVRLGGLDSPEGLTGSPQSCLCCSGRCGARQGTSIWQSPAEFMNVPNHNFLISKPQSVWELNRAWNIIISLGPHVDLPFISDLVNLLSPKQNLIKNSSNFWASIHFLPSSPLLSFPCTVKQMPHSILPFRKPLKENKLSKWPMFSLLFCYGSSKRKESLRECRNVLDNRATDWRQRSQTQDPGESFCASYSTFLFCFLSFKRMSNAWGGDSGPRSHWVGPGLWRCSK